MEWNVFMIGPGIKEIWAIKVVSSTAGHPVCPQAVCIGITFQTLMCLTKKPTFANVTSHKIPTTYNKQFHQTLLSQTNRLHSGDCGIASIMPARIDIARGGSGHLLPTNSSTISITICDFGVDHEQAGGWSNQEPNNVDKWCRASVKIKVYKDTSYSANAIRNEIIYHF